MHQLIKAVFIGILPLVTTPAAQAEASHQNRQTPHSEMKEEQQVINASGVVKDIDFKHKKITITHEAISSIGWPAMTMRFTYATADEGIRALQPGNNVTFSFVQQGNVSQLKDIQATQQ